MLNPAIGPRYSDVSLLTFLAMARQDNKLPFVGRIGELIYYKRNGKYFVHRAGYPSKEKINTAPEFEKARKLNREFGGCIKVGHDLRKAIGSL